MVLTGGNMNKGILEIAQQLKECDDTNSLTYAFCEYEFKKMIEADLCRNNPQDIFHEYFEYFSSKEYSKQMIKQGDKFYRGRIGKLIVPGAIDDCNQKFIIPFYGEMIKSVPPLYANDGRFNKSGVSYFETCLAEVHLQVGQECSIGTFECMKDIDMINISNYGNDLELKIWFDIITKPVIKTQNDHAYHITQSLASVLSKISPNGIFYKSVQSLGQNIVCFNQENFKLIPYSEGLYVATKIKYDFTKVKDTVEEFTNRDDDYLINSFNSDDEDKNEKQINYLCEWIRQRKSITPAST